MVSIPPILDESDAETNFEEHVNMLMCEVMHSKINFCTRFTASPRVHILELRMSHEAFDTIYSKITQLFKKHQLERLVSILEQQRNMSLNCIIMQTRFSIVCAFTFMIPILERVWDATTLDRKNNAQNLLRGEVCEAIRLVALGAYNNHQKQADCEER